MTMAGDFGAEPVTAATDAFPSGGLEILEFA